VKLLVAVGGGSAGSTPYSDMASTQDRRSSFIGSLVGKYIFLEASVRRYSGEILSADIVSPIGKGQGIQRRGISYS
jgi:hypothetical protein